MMLRIKRQREKGFTLIELLVVIAIIAILASILLPVFATARERARQSSCQNNLKQLGTAISSYAQDYDENFPFGYTQGNWANSGWASNVFPYVKSVGVFKCPDDSTNGNAGANPPTNPVSYAYNYSLTGDGAKNQKYGALGGGPAGTGTPVKLSLVASPAVTVEILEVFGIATYYQAQAENQSPLFGQNGVISSNGGTVFGPSFATGIFLNSAVNAGNSLPAGAVHNSNTTSNFLACDGHVKSLRPTQVSASPGSCGLNCPDAQTSNDKQGANNEASGTSCLDNGSGACGTAVMTWSKT